MQNRTKIIENIRQNFSIIKFVESIGQTPDNKGFIKTIYKPENTRSLQTFSKTNSYYCYATAKGGDVIQFYMDYYKIGFNQALEEMKALMRLYQDQFPSRNPSKKFNAPEKLILLGREIYDFDERAGKYEFEARFSRSEAEKLALQDLRDIRHEISDNCRINFERRRNYFHHFLVLLAIG
jgi:DNA primase